MKTCRVAERLVVKNFHNRGNIVFALACPSEDASGSKRMFVNCWNLGRVARLPKPNGHRWPCGCFEGTEEWIAGVAPGKTALCGKSYCVSTLEQESYERQSTKNPALGGVRSLIW